MHRAVPALVGVLVATLLSSCTDGADAGPDGSADSSSGPATTSTAPTGTTPPTTSSSTRPPPEPPTMPALAQEKSTAGAKAFVKYYIDVLNYSGHAGLADPLLLVSDEKCLVCTKVAESAERYSKNGGYIHGGDWTVRRLTELPGSTSSRVELGVVISIAEGTWKKSDADPIRRIKKATVSNRFSVVWSGGRWRTRAISTL